MTALKSLLVMAAVLVGASSAFADVYALSFKGSKSLNEVKAGTLKNTLRLGDRTAAPQLYKVGMVVPLVNSDEKEDVRKFGEQIAANAYGKVEFTAVKVAQFGTLSPAEQKQITDFYTAEKIAEAKNVVTILGLKFQN